ncbi:MAG: hypothetical protein ACM30G_05035 [Micromonosporaceae bacterium]
MGDWTGTVPTIYAGSVPNGDDWSAITGELTALSAVLSDWSPILTNLTQGSGTITAKYTRVGKVVDWYFRFVFGAGSAVGTDPTWSLPATPASFYPVAEGFGRFPGEAHLVDSGTAARPGNLFHAAATTVGVTFWNATPTVATVTATAPWTWATNDSIAAWGRFWTD